MDSAAVIPTENKKTMYQVNLRAVLFCFALLTGGLSMAAAGSPNIVLILTDDHGWSQLNVAMDPDVPVAKSDYLETPNMSTLASRGMRFASGYSPAPLCTPTRRSILCGTSAARSGPEFSSSWVPKDHLTIPMALKSVDQDYRCAHFGKWGEKMISTPEECGYDSSDGMTGNNTGGMPSSLGVKGGHENGPPHFIDNQDPKRTSSVTDRAVSFMGQQAKNGKPFYVQVSYYAQHLSVVTSDKMLAKYQAKGTPDRRYTQAWASMMEELDQGVGRLIQAIDELQIADSTYIFLTADNGGRGTVPAGGTEREPTNTPLTGAKHSLYEGGIRVPFIAAGPGIPAESVCRTPVVGYDFLPTFHDLAGGNKDQLTDELDGVSFAELLSHPDGGALNRRDNAIIFHRPRRLFSAIRDQNYKLMLHWKKNGKIDRHELFDMSANPVEEGNDVSVAQSSRALKMQQRLLAYLESVEADTPILKPSRKR